MKHQQNKKSPVARLQLGLTGSRELIGKSYMDDPSLLKAYFDYYWPVSFQQTKYALLELFGNSEKLLSFIPKSLIDVGSGPGPVASAFAEMGTELIFLIDQSQKALSLAREKQIAKDVQTLCMDIENPIPKKIALWGKAQCISFGHSLNEIGFQAENPLQKRIEVLEKWAEALSPKVQNDLSTKPFILILEPALLSTSRDLLLVRNELVLRGWSVLAPCYGRENLPCPAIQAGLEQTCHSDISWQIPLHVKKNAQKLGISKDTLKVTWLALSPPEQNPQNKLSYAQKNGDRAQIFLRDSENSNKLENLQIPTEESYTCRVVSEVLTNKAGRLRRLICGSRGRFPLSINGDRAELKSTQFELLSRGELICIVNPEIRESGWGIKDQTKIERLSSFAQTASSHIHLDPKKNTKKRS